MTKQLVPQSACLKCKGCCRFAQAVSIWTPYLLDKEISALAKDILLPSMISSSKRICAVPSKTQEFFFCPFLNVGKNKCKIYPRRPFECQLYPFIINRKDKKVFLAVDLQCPFAKGNLESGAFKEYVGYLTSRLNSKSYQDILKNNPQIIQRYDAALNLRELNC